MRTGSPADSAGFVKGDVIAALDGKPASAWRLASLRAAWRRRAHAIAPRSSAGAGATVPLEFTVHLVSIEDR